MTNFLFRTIRTLWYLFWNSDPVSMPTWARTTWLILLTLNSITLFAAIVSWMIT